jgi:hypothetical protein
MFCIRTGIDPVYETWYFINLLLFEHETVDKAREEKYSKALECGFTLSCVQQSTECNGQNFQSQLQKRVEDLVVGQLSLANRLPHFQLFG